MKRQRRVSGRRICYALAAAAFLPGVVGATEITSTWSGNTGNWTDPTQWSTNPNYPNNGTPSGTTYDAVIDAPGTGPYTVSLASDVTTDSVTLDLGNATLSQTSGTLTTMTMNIAAGDYNLNDSTFASGLLFNTGTIQITNSSSLNLGTLYNASGVVDVDASSMLSMGELVGLGDIVNNGTVQLVDSVYNNAGQTFAFGGPTGTWIADQTEIDGGTINFAPTTILEGGPLGQAVVFKNVTLGSNLTMSQAGGTLAVADLNGGGYAVNIAGNGTSLRVDGTGVSLTGTLSNVTVNLGGSTTNGTGGYVYARGNGLVLDSLTTVQGWGEVGIQPNAINASGSLVNNGLISANVSGQTLSIVPNLTNNGTVQAINGGILNVYAYTGFGTIEGVFAIDSQSRINVGLSAFVENNSVLDVALGSNGASGILSINGSINFLGEADLNLSLAPGAVFSTPYEIASYTGTLTGTFSNVTPGFVVDYSQSGEILVTAVPEPGACMLVAGGALISLRRRRRRAFS
jgi:hypothetical protein